MTEKEFRNHKKNEEFVSWAERKNDKFLAKNLRQATTLEQTKKIVFMALFK